jgi:hypothetical protein
MDSEERDLGVRGGQGRWSADARDSALSLVWACMILLAAVCLFLLAGCQHLKRLGPF